MAGKELLHHYFARLQETSLAYTLFHKIAYIQALNSVYRVFQLDKPTVPFLSIHALISSGLIPSNGSAAFAPFVTCIIHYFISRLLIAFSQWKVKKKVPTSHRQ